MAALQGLAILGAVIVLYYLSVALGPVPSIPEKRLAGLKPNEGGESDGI